jgi:integrase/recombinase XerD
VGTRSLRRFPKINLSKYVKVGPRQWRFCQVIVSANGRIKPDCVMVSGKPEVHREGAYYIEWYEKGARRRRSVGESAIEAQAEQQRQIQLLRNEALGIEVIRAESPLDAATVAESCEAFLEEMRQRSRRKTYQQYSVALRYFQECCRDKQFAQIGRGDLLKFLAFLRDEKRLSNRTSWTKLNVVVQWLKANGSTRLLKRTDWPRYVETEPETYTVEEVDQFLAACNPVEHTLFEWRIEPDLRC